MKLYAPEYYLNFKCVADKCEHSCCIGWEIDIDKSALDNYKDIPFSYGQEIRNSIDFYGTPHFRLGENEHCPHLNENGLCKIIINCGEEYICDICREHPRFYNFTNFGKEVGIGLSCEAACDLIIQSDNFDNIIEIGEVVGDIDECDFNALESRDIVFRILKDPSLRIDGKIEMLYDYFDVFLYNYSFESIISKLEYLNDEHKSLFSKAKYLIWNDGISDELTRILAYFVFRHCSEAFDFDEFCISLSFAIFCTGLISSLADRLNISEIARIVSEEIEYSQENTDMIKSLFCLTT